MTFTPLNLDDKNSGLWLNCKEGSFKENSFTLSNSVLSSCEKDSPVWKFAFSEGKYNAEKEWLHLYHPRVYAGDVPVFYLPYFGFPTSDERQSGLLIPKIGLSEDEGFYYEQPIYFVLGKSYDLELTPQIRTSRGYGLYSTFRFVDSKYSKGSFTAGYFKEFDDYIDTFDLYYKQHYGYDLNYENSSLLASENSSLTDGLYLDIHSLSDVDYINLKESSIVDSNVTPYIESTVNYGLSSSFNFFGLYLKSYEDLTQVGDSDSLNTMPSVQYHYFTDRAFKLPIYYNVDYRYNNFESESGLSVEQHQVEIPVSIHFSNIFDLFHFNVSRDIYVSKFNYKSSFQTNNSYIDKVDDSSDKVILYMDVAKPYKEFWHVIQMNFSYENPSDRNIEYIDGYENDGISGYAINTYDEKSYIKLPVEAYENRSLGFQQNLFDMSGREILFHKVDAHKSLDNSIDSWWLTHDTKLCINGDDSISNYFVMSLDTKEIERSVTSFNFSDEKTTFAFNHFYRNSDSVISESLGVNGKYIVNKKYSMFGIMDYDVESEVLRRGEIGFSMKENCWDYTVSYKHTTSSLLNSSGGIDTFTDNILFVRINLASLGGVEQDFEIMREKQ